jgi:hypothetical protein
MTCRLAIEFLAKEKIFFFFSDTSSSGYREMKNVCSYAFALSYAFITALN